MQLKTDIFWLTYMAEKIKSTTQGETTITAQSLPSIFKWSAAIFQ